MQWIDTNDLKTWAKRLDARQLLIEMVADLIRATVTDASRFRFPSGDAGQVRGFDGDLETAEPVGVVPAGRSKWEFGVASGARKAHEDYDKRTTKTPVNMMSENALVLVNLDTWDTPRESIATWEAERVAEGKWRDVKYIDGAAIVDWLKECPAVAAKYARLVLNLAPKEGALSCDEYWEMYSSGFERRLTEQVVLCDREEAAKQLLDQLAGPPQSIMIGAESSEEVIAFAVAAIRAAPKDRRAYFEARTMIVESEAAARLLSVRKNLAFITTKTADKLAGMLASKAPTVSGATGVQARRHPPLKRPSASLMAEAFETMNYTRADGYELAHRCGRSLTILRRLIPSGPVHPPGWTCLAGMLKPAFLAGGWTVNTRLDKELLVELAGTTDYLSFENGLRPTLTLSDPPVDRVENVWQVRAPVDAFQHYGHLINDSDLEKLRSAAIKVFSHAVPRPSRTERFSLTYTPPESYSSWLRDGLALTLLLIAAMHDVGGVQIPGKTAQQYVDEILNSIPGFGKDHETLLAILDQSSVLAEAAPRPFLSAIESMLEGDRSEAKKLFTENGDDEVFGSSSPHIHVLWALEVLAWDPKLLQRVGIVLAKLSEVDPSPNSRSMNRPFNSLRAIFLSWSPNTYATLKQRIACLDTILNTVPAIAWDLLIKLMPRAHDSSSPTQKPKLRDASPLVPEQLSFGVVWDSEAAIIDRAIALARGQEGRVLHIVKIFAQFQPNSRKKALELIDDHLCATNASQGSEVWHELREEVSRHEYFEASDWALAAEELNSIKAILDRYSPVDPLVRDRQLFDDWHPHLGRRDDENDMERIDEARVDALKRLWSAEGPAGIVRMARLVKLPQLLAEPLDKLPFSIDNALAMLRDGLGPGSALLDFTVPLSAVSHGRFGEEWEAVFKRDILPACASTEIGARLLLAWPLNEKTWDFVEGLSLEVKRQYWSLLYRLPHDASDAVLKRAVAEFRAVGRSLDVFDLLHRRIGRLSGDLILALLDEGYVELTSGKRLAGGMLSYHLNDAFDALQKGEKATPEEIARREYLYLPLLEREGKSLALHDFMAKDPTFYIEVLSHVFSEKNGPKPESISDADRARADTSYRLLSSFKKLPGQSENSLDDGALKSWVEKAREIASQRDRAEIGDEYIGHFLAYAPMDPETGGWPHKGLCRLLEYLSADWIERGIEIERYNMRGIYSKSFDEGGQQERRLAKTYTDWAALIPEYPRTSDMLQRVAEGWEGHASQADIRAEQRKLKQ